MNQELNQSIKAIVLGILFKCRQADRRAPLVMHIKGKRILHLTSPRKCASPTHWLPLRIFFNRESEGQTIQQWGRADRIHFFPPQVITPDTSPMHHLKTVWINNDLVFLHPGTKTKQIRGYFTCGYGSDNSLYEKEWIIPFSSALSPFLSLFLEWPGPLQHREGRQPGNHSPAPSCRGAPLPEYAPPWQFPWEVRIRGLCVFPPTATAQRTPV